MKLSQILENKGGGTVVAKESATVAEAVAIMCGKHVGCVIIQNKKRSIAGILTERDILRHFASSGQALAAMRVSEVMSTQVTVAPPDMRADEALGLMTQRRFRHLPIVKAGKLLGLISIGDLVKAQLAEKSAEAEFLRDYIVHS